VIRRSIVSRSIVRRPMPRPVRRPGRGTFGARKVTRAALVLLVAGVLLGALTGHLSGHPSGHLTGRDGTTGTAPASKSSAPKSSPSGGHTT
jgi:hypothetical protein